MKKVAFYTLGCKVNQYESEAMAEIFEKQAYELTDFEDRADIYIINTCTVTNQSDKKSRQMIGRARKKNPQALVAVVGCYPQASPEEVEKLEGVDVIIGTDRRKEIVQLCEQALAEKGRVNVVGDVFEARDFEGLAIDTEEGRTRAYMKVQEGCNMFCSYCIIPYARGALRSRPLAHAVQEAERLAARGYKELILTGIHIASYGKDLEGVKLLDLIQAVAQVEGVERIRLSSMEPRLVSKAWLEGLQATGKVCDHFHLSLQSGSDRVLKRMNRKYDRALYRSKVEEIRQVFPHAGLTTDIIVGFPGEREEDFQETLDLVREIGFSRIHVFRYSKREGTPAASMDQEVDGLVARDRAQRLEALAQEMTLEFLEAEKNRVHQVLFEEKEEEGGLMGGYTTNYLRVETPYRADRVGKIVPLKVDQIRAGSFYVDKID